MQYVHHGSQANGVIHYWENISGRREGRLLLQVITMPHHPVNLDWNAGLLLWALNLLGSVNVVDLATTALAEGIDSPSLRKLAGVEPADAGWADLRPVFEDALAEVGVQLPDPAIAACLLATRVSRDVLAGRVEPRQAAHFLTKVSLQVGPGFHALDAFVYADSELEDRPEDSGVLMAMIRDEAERWAQSG